MTLVRTLATTSVILEIIGVSLLIFLLVSLAREQAVSAAQPYTVVPTSVEKPVYEPETIHGRPVSISIPSLGISTHVVDGYYNAQDGRWTINEESAFFATPYDEINNTAGSSFIYGHNSDTIFGKLRDIKSGAEAIVRTDNDYEFTYVLTGVEHVSPNAGDKLKYTGGSPRLVLQTCSGFWNETRQLTYFMLEDYKKL